MSTEYSATQIAKAIVKETKRQDYYINITKLQKLLYIVYGIYLVENDKELFNEKPICDNFGPLFPSAYRDHNQGNLDISIDYRDYNDVQDEIINDTIERVVEVFGKFRAKTLSDWSHRDDGAWAKTRKQFGSKAEITIDDIKQEFNEFMGD